MRHIRDVEKLNTPSLLHLLQKKKKNNKQKLKHTHKQWSQGQVT